MSKHLRVAFMRVVNSNRNLTPTSTWSGSPLLPAPAPRYSLKSLNDEIYRDRTNTQLIC